MTNYIGRAIIVAASLFTLSTPMISIAQADVITERQANFKQNGAAIRAMRGQFAEGDYLSIELGAETIAGWAAKMTDYFPAGSDTGKTDAKPDIWERFDEFTLLAKQNEEAALALAKAASAEDSGQTQMLMQALGKTCGACHSQFKK